MTLSELSRIYNFHDCDVFIPFDVNQDSITVTFDLAKHMQYGELKARYSEYIKNADFHLLATVKFSNCSNVRASEWTFDYSSKGTPNRLYEKKHCCRTN